MTSRWILALAILGSASCGPSLSAGEDAPTSTPSSTDASGGSTAATGSGSDPASSGSQASTATGSSTDPDLDCGSANPVDGCPSGCMDAMRFLGTGNDIDVDSGVRGCIAAGAMLDAGYRSTWWRADGAERWFLIAGYGCQGKIHRAPLEDWQECGTSEDEPPECRWLCAQDVCQGELDWDELSACDVPSPCPSVQLCWTCDPVATPELQCMHGALASRTPGRYEIEFECPNASQYWTFVVADDGSVQVLAREWASVCHTALIAMWQPSQTCELADAQFFTACFEAEAWCEGDLDCSSESLSGWFLGCQQIPATCS